MEELQTAAHQMPGTSDQGAAQTLIINYRKPKKPKIKEHFKGHLAKILGSLLLVCGAVLIVLQSVGVHLYHEKSALGYEHTGRQHLASPAVLSAPGIFLAGSFAIVASKYKRTGFIITTLVFSVLSAVGSFPVVTNSASHVADEAREIEQFYSNYSRWEPEQVEPLRKSSQALSVVMLILGLTDFVCTIVLSAICCSVVCCCNKPNEDAPDEADPTQVVFLNAPSGPHTLTMERPCMDGQVPVHHGHVPPTYGISTYQTVDEGASGLPPSYSTSEIHKVGLKEDEGAHSYTDKVPL